jgi:hypothetical protein
MSLAKFIITPKLSNNHQISFSMSLWKMQNNYWLWMEEMEKEGKRQK